MTDASDDSIIGTMPDWQVELGRQITAASGHKHSVSIASHLSLAPASASCSWDGCRDRYFEVGLATQTVLSLAVGCGSVRLKARGLPFMVVPAPCIVMAQPTEL